MRGEPLRDATILIPWLRLDAQEIVALTGGATRKLAGVAGDRAFLPKPAGSGRAAGTIRGCAAGARSATVDATCRSRREAKCARADRGAYPRGGIGRGRCGRIASSPAGNHADCDAIFRRNGFHLSLRSHRANCSPIGYRVADGSLDSNLLRSARLGSAACQFHRHRERRRSVGSLVPPWPRSDAGGPRVGADFVVGIDVRIPDAAARDAVAGGQPSEPDVRRSWCSGKLSTEKSAAFRGEFRNRRSTRVTSTSRINTPASECRDLG